MTANDRLAPSTDALPRLIAAADKMHDVEKLVGAMGRRMWPTGTAVYLPVVEDGFDNISAVYSHAIGLIGDSQVHAAKRFLKALPESGAG